MITGEVDTPAVISEYGQYRFRLRRIAGMGQGICAFITLNPSTADDETNDSTLRRCIGFARGWDYRELIVVDAFALRSTDPKELLRHPVPVGPGNDDYIGLAMDLSDLVVVAWGADAAVEKYARDVRFRRDARERGKDRMCLGVTQGGYPRHPLYIPKTQSLVRYAATNEAHGDARRPFPTERWLST